VPWLGSLWWQNTVNYNSSTKQDQHLSGPAFSSLSGQLSRPPHSLGDGGARGH
jgi:hypothetical protein